VKRKIEKKEGRKGERRILKKEKEFTPRNCEKTWQSSIKRPKVEGYVEKES